MSTAAGQRPANEASAYEIVCRALFDLSFQNQFCPKLTAAGEQVLEEAGIRGAERDGVLRVLNLAVSGLNLQNPAQKQIQEFQIEQQVETARQQLAAVKIQLKQQVEFIGGDKERLDETMSVITAMKDGLRKTIDQIDRAFAYTMWMYIVSFLMGVALLGAAIWSAFYGKNLLTLVLGGLGTANTLTFFLARPPERLQSSRASLAQLQIALLAWFADFFNQNILMAQLNQAQLAAGKGLNKKPFDELSETLMRHTERMMLMLQTFCKLVENPLNSTTPPQADPKPPEQTDASPERDDALPS
jgi:hypothetical protein